MLEVAMLVLGVLATIAAIIVIPEVRQWLGIEKGKIFEPNLSLDRISNPRFCFSFLYPTTWDRLDPTNGDGYRFANPKDNKIALVGWGANIVISSQNLDSYARKKPDEKEKQKILESAAHGLFAFEWAEHDGSLVETREPIEGWRKKIECKCGKIVLTRHEVRAYYSNVEYGLDVQVPKRLYRQYEDLVLVLLNSFRVLKRPEIK